MSYNTVHLIYGLIVLTDVKVILCDTWRSFKMLVFFYFLHGLQVEG